MVWEMNQWYAQIHQLYSSIPCTIQELDNGTASLSPAISNGMQSHFGFMPGILGVMVAQWVALLALSSRVPDLILI